MIDFDENAAIYGHLVRVTTFGSEVWIRSESVADPGDWIELRLPTGRAQLATRLVSLLKAAIAVEAT